MAMTRFPIDKATVALARICDELPPLNALLFKPTSEETGVLAATDKKRVVIHEMERIECDLDRGPFLIPQAAILKSGPTITKMGWVEWMPLAEKPVIITGKGSNFEFHAGDASRCPIDGILSECYVNEPVRKIVGLNGLFMQEILEAMTPPDWKSLLKNYAEKIKEKLSRSVSLYHPLHVQISVGTGNGRMVFRHEKAHSFNTGEIINEPRRNVKAVLMPLDGGMGGTESEIGPDEEPEPAQVEEETPEEETPVHQICPKCSIMRRSMSAASNSMISAGNAAMKALKALEEAMKC